MQNMTESELDKIVYELLDKYLENNFKSTKKLPQMKNNMI